FLSCTLYFAMRPEMDLYVMCFLIIYFSTLSRKVKDALPLALAACLMYALMLNHRNIEVLWTDPVLLLRFAFFFVLSLFTSYLAEQTEVSRQKVSQMQEVQKLLSGQLQKALVDLRDKQAALVQAEKLTAMGHMAGALAHEIRNPLAVIIGFVK